MARIECDYTKDGATRHYKADIAPLPCDVTVEFEP